jgi:hypothetical protein
MSGQERSCSRKSADGKAMRLLMAMTVGEAVDCAGRCAVEVRPRSTHAVDDDWPVAEMCMVSDHEQTMMRVRVECWSFSVVAENSDHGKIYMCVVTTLLLWLIPRLDVVFFYTCTCNAVEGKIYEPQ